MIYVFTKCPKGFVDLYFQAPFAFAGRNLLDAVALSDECLLNFTETLECGICGGAAEVRVNIQISSLYLCQRYFKRD